MGLTQEQNHFAGVSKMVLDPACGSRMMYFDKQDQRVLFGDIRNESHVLCDGRALEIRPSMLMDYERLPFSDGAFKMVIFDPPHLKHAGPKSWLRKKYGVLPSDFQAHLRKGFSECFRVLEPHGTLVFKWAAVQVPLAEILALTPEQPICGNRKPVQSGTHWVLFMKGAT